MTSKTSGIWAPANFWGTNPKVKWYTWFNVLKSKMIYTFTLNTDSKLQS